MAKPKRKITELVAHDLAAGEGKLKTVGGSRSDDFNNILINQTVQTLWLKNSDPTTVDRQLQAALAGLMGIAPRDELEGMLAAQMVAAHNASMECFRRAMLNEQTFEGRKENLTQANKLSRTYTMLLDALNRHRGKGQQKVTVEHVHVHAGGQAIVGAVEGGGGASPGNQRQPHAKAISRSPDASLASLWGQDAEREPVLLTGHAER